MTQQQATYTSPAHRGDFARDYSDRFDVGQLLRRLKRGWYWFALALLVAGLAAWAYLRYAAPVYAASALMIIEDEQAASGLSPEALGAELGFATSYELENEVQVLKSRALMRQVVDSLELNLTYTHLGRVRDVELFHPEGLRVELLDSVAYDPLEPVTYGAATLMFDAGVPDGALVVRGEGEAADTSRVSYGGSLRLGNRYFTLAEPDSLTRPLAPAPGADPEAYVVRWADPDAVAAAYAGQLAVDQVERSNVIALGLTDVSPERVAAVLNALVYFYDRGIVAETGLAGAQTLEFIGERLGEMREELFDVESRIEAYKRKQNLAVGVSGTAADYLSRLNASDQVLAELQVRREIIGEALRTISDPEAAYEPLPLSSEVLDGQLAGLVQTYNELIFERDNKLEAATAANPAVQTFDERLGSLRATVARSLRRLSNETLERERRARERIAPLEQSLTTIPTSERELLQLEREQQIKQNLYVFLAERREEAAITVAGQRGNTRLVEPARVPGYPVSPNPVPTYALALALALALPATVLAGIELIDDKVRSVGDLATGTGVPVLGSIVEGDTGAGGLAVTPGSRSMASEQFRLVRTNLSLHLGASERTSVVIVTSGSSGEGKSYVSANLAAAAALAGRRVCLVEADMRKPVLDERLRGDLRDAAAADRPGLADVLTGQANLAAAVAPTKVDRLDVVAGGRAPSSSAELLADGRARGLFAELREAYDLVVVDTAPVGLVTDALLLREDADATVFVVRYGHTPKDVVRLVGDYGGSGSLPGVSLVLNGVPKDATGTYGRGSGYYEG